MDDIQFRAKRAKDQTLDSSYYVSISKRKLPTFEDNIKILIKYFGGSYEKF